MASVLNHPNPLVPELKQAVRVSWVLLTKARQFPDKVCVWGNVFSGSKVLEFCSISLFPCTKRGVAAPHSGSGSQLFAVVLNL